MMTLTALMALWKTADGKKKIRSRMLLWIGYAMLAVVIVTTVMVINLRHRVEVTELKNQVLEGDLEKVKSANESLVDSFNLMRRLRDLDSGKIAGLGEDLSSQRVNHAQVQSRLTQLEIDNASVRQFLDTPTPDDVVGCVLDDSCGSQNRTGVRPATKATEGAVR